MEITLSNDIKITADETVLDEIEKHCTYLNPKYDEAQRMGFSFRKIERYLRPFVRTKTAICVPIGMLDELKKQFPFIQVIDDRKEIDVEIIFNGKLRSYQKRFIQKAINRLGGQMVAATGSGKTISGIAMAAELCQRTLILVKSKDLAAQWIDAIEQFTGCSAGLIGGGKSTQGEQFTIALTQSLIRWDRDDLAALDYGLVIADECHNLPAHQAFKVINSINAQYKFGLSATPQRRDNLEFMIDLAVGKICAEIAPTELEGAVLPVKIQRYEHEFYDDIQFETWSDYINIISNDNFRNHFIIDCSDDFVSRESPTIILTGTVEHCEILTTLAEDLDLNPLLIHGQLPAKTRKSRMAAAPDSMLIIGTLQLLSEGVDWPRFENLIFGNPVSANVDKENPAATRLLQSIGRCRRPFPGKTHANVIDIVDQCGFGKSAWRKRSRIYAEHKFEVEY